jgi:hypothetical protein
MTKTIQHDHSNAITNHDDDEWLFGLAAEEIPEEQLAKVTGGGRFAHPSEATTIPAVFYQ